MQHCRDEWTKFISMNCIGLCMPIARQHNDLIDYFQCFVESKQKEINRWHILCVSVRKLHSNHSFINLHVTTDQQHNSAQEQTISKNTNVLQCKKKKSVVRKQRQQT